jgi:phosphoribosyl 1,2-cyclic phosphodiesterase
VRDRPIVAHGVSTEIAARLVFLGTRGEIPVRSRRHRRHSSLLVEHASARVMIDCGTDWRSRVHSIQPTFIVLTHGHPDHAWGLADGSPCPVYATQSTLELIADYPIREPRLMPLRTAIEVGGIGFEAFPVDHSTRAPAVGYRVTVAQRCFFYVPDVVAIHDRHAALHGAEFYIGDGATIRRSMVRRRDGALIGHAPITTQLGWCAKEGVGRAIFTHCGSEIVKGDERRLGPLVRRLASERGLDARIARDGLQMSLVAESASAAGPPGRQHA